MAGEKRLVVVGATGMVGDSGTTTERGVDRAQQAIAEIGFLSFSTKYFDWDAAAQRFL